MKETTAPQKHDKSDEIEGLTTKLEQATAESATLKEEVATLLHALSKPSKSQAELDKLRQEQKEMKETTAKKDDKLDEIEGLATKLEQATAKSGHRGRAV